jgi:hypothetical protein
VQPTLHGEASVDVKESSHQNNVDLKEGLIQKGQQLNLKEAYTIRRTQIIGEKYATGSFH